MKSLKSVVKFWQEIVFTVSIGLLLIVLTKWVYNSNTMDRWDIFLASFLLPLFICLIGQFFWKNGSLAVILAFLLGLSSIVFIFMSVYYMSTTSTEMVQAIIMFVMGFLYLGASFTMPIKFFPNENNGNVLNTEI